MEDLSAAQVLARSLTEVARAQGVQATAVLTPMEEPLGWKVGNQLEVEECADYLAGTDREAGLHEVTLALAAEMLVLCARGKWTAAQAREACEETLATTEPSRVFVELFENQGGSWAAFERRRATLASRPCVSFKADRAGTLRTMSARAIGKLVHALGGGRQSKEKGIDPDVGAVLYKKVGDRVEAGEKIFDVLLSEEKQRELVSTSQGHFFEVSTDAVEKTRWVQEVMRAG